MIKGLKEFKVDNKRSNPIGRRSVDKVKSIAATAGVSFGGIGMGVMLMLFQSLGALEAENKRIIDTLQNHQVLLIDCLNHQENKE